MIALDMKMPITCAECPCYQTLQLYNSKTKIEDKLARRCSANGRVMKEIEWKEGDPSPDESWYDFTKPEWCPLIDLSHDNRG